jgi:hypothetical protein
LLCEDELVKTKFFDHKKVHALLKKIESGASTSETEGMALMGLISTEVVHNRFIDNFSSPDGLSVHWDMYFDKKENPVYN